MELNCRSLPFAPVQVTARSSGLIIHYSVLIGWDGVLGDARILSYQGRSFKINCVYKKQNFKHVFAETAVCANKDTDQTKQ